MGVPKKKDTVISDPSQDTLYKIIEACPHADRITAYFFAEGIARVDPTDEDAALEYIATCKAQGIKPFSKQTLGPFPTQEGILVPQKWASNEPFMVYESNTAVPRREISDRVIEEAAKAYIVGGREHFLRVEDDTGWGLPALKNLLPTLRNTGYHIGFFDMWLDSESTGCCESRGVESKESLSHYPDYGRLSITKSHDWWSEVRDSL